MVDLSNGSWLFDDYFFVLVKFDNKKNILLKYLCRVPLKTFVCSLCGSAVSGGVVSQCLTGAPSLAFCHD